MERRPLGKRKIRRRQLAIFTPDWEHGPYRMWASNFVAKNQWRVQHIFLDHEECMGEVALIFAICFRKYYGKVHAPKHFMALFKISVINKWNRYSRQDEKYRSLIDSHIAIEPNANSPVGTDEHKSSDNWGDARNPFTEPSEDAIGPLAMAIEELPAEALLALRRLIEAPAEVISFIFRAAPHGRNGVPSADPVLWDESRDKLIRRLFRIAYPRKDQAHDIVQSLRALTDIH